MKYLILSVALLITLNTYSRDIPAPDFKLYEVQEGETVLQTDENGSTRRYLIGELQFLQDENILSQSEKNKIYTEINRIIKEANLIHVQAWGENKMIAFSTNAFKSSRFQQALLRIGNEEKIVRKLFQVRDNLDINERVLLECKLKIDQRKRPLRFCQFAIDRNIVKFDIYELAQRYNINTESIDDIIKRAVYNLLSNNFHDEESINSTISKAVKNAKLKPYTYGLNIRGKKVQKRVNTTVVNNLLISEIKDEVSIFLSRSREIEKKLIDEINAELNDNKKLVKSEVYSRIYESRKITKYLTQDLYKIYLSHLRSINGSNIIRIKDRIQISNLNQNDDTTRKETQSINPSTGTSHVQEL